MSRLNEILVIIPAFNEELSIARAITEIKECDFNADVLVVDDGSTDQTAEIAKKNGAKVLQLPFNTGVGGAMRAGFRFANESSYEIAVQFDADCQHDPKYLGELVSCIGPTCDVAIGSRFLDVGNYRTIGPRRWGMRLLAFSLSRLTSTKLTDVTSGFRASSSRAIDLFSKEYPPEYLGDTVESLIIAHNNGLQIKEIGVEMRYRVAGKASQSVLQATLYFARAILVLLMVIIQPKKDLDA